MTVPILFALVIVAGLSLVAAHDTLETFIQSGRWYGALVALLAVLGFLVALLGGKKLGVSNELRRYEDDEQARGVKR